MSEPKENDLIGNIIGASSSLNMKPEPMDDIGDGEFLADIDVWCNHAHKHLVQAFADAVKLEAEIKAFQADAGEIT